MKLRKSILPLLCAAFSIADAFADDLGEGRYRRVLLISVDGLHAIDLANFIKSHPGSTLAALSGHGVTYSNASSSKPSDSFPGILALTTGGSPNSTGVWYDDSYDRKLAPPLSNSNAGLTGTCTPGVFPGTEVILDESIDKDPSKLNGGATGTTNISAINPDALPRDPARNCAPVYPHDFLRANTIFEVVRSAGGRTAWSDKHPAYDLLNGPSGKGVDDLYNPEVAAPLSGLGVPAASIAAIEAYDDIKVQAILNEIDGKDHTGTIPAPVPALFVMNFQAVSVGQKIVAGGYTDELATPSANLLNAIEHTDASLDRMVQRLKDRGLYASTLIVISAKHGQSPIDRRKLRTLKTVPGITARPSGLLPDAAQVTEDDIALIWLNSGLSLPSDLAILESNLQAAAIQKIFAGESLKLVYNDPALDSRVPDIIVQPELGVIYTKSSSKIAEHGGFAEDDVHVALLLATPGGASRQIKAPVTTAQVAPTILSVLGLNPQSLQAVEKEHTPVLPGLQLSRED